MYDYKRQELGSLGEPMFKPAPYGRTVNLFNTQMQFELEEYKKKINEPVIFPLGDNQYLQFEIEMSRKYRSQFKALVKKYHNLETASQTLTACGNPSNLINYWYKVQKEKKEAKKNEKNTVSATCEDSWEETVSA